MKTCIRLTALSALAIAFAASSVAQLAPGFAQTFSTGTSNWVGGALPTHVTTGGPAGAGDGFLQITSNGLQGQGSHLATPNSSDWNGNFTALGIGAIECDMRNTGSTVLSMRVVLFSSMGSRYVSTNAVTLNPGSGWQKVRFSLAASDMTLNSGTDSHAVVMGSIFQVMFRHQTTTAGNGVSIAAQLGIDNVTASAGRMVSGNITLQDYTVASGFAPATFQFYAPGGTSVLYQQSSSINLATGAFSVPATPVPGNYDMRVKGSTWLKGKVAVNTTAGNVTGVSKSLRNGDCNGDGVIDLSDYTIVAVAFNALPASPNWNVSADLNGDQVVDLTDYTIVAIGFNALDE